VEPRGGFAMVTPQLFEHLVEAASRAPSADNMQPWEFRHRDGAVEVLVERGRALPTDVLGMFTWIGIGAAIENLVVAAALEELATSVSYGAAESDTDLAARVLFARGGACDPLAASIDRRITNRRPYDAAPLGATAIARLSEAARGLDAGIHWVTAEPDLARMAALDSRSTYIRLEHKPLHDEVFDILRFTRKEVESTRYGLDFASLEVPFGFVFMARQLRHWSVNRTISRLGIGRVVAKMLASRLRQAGALCLITARRRDPAGYMEAGRAMERIWLAATGEGLGTQPFGVLPQYLTKVEVEPESFLPAHAAVLRSHRETFFSLFPGARDEHPAIVLRVGRPAGTPGRRSVRLRPHQLIRR
jgi:nitroreductase